MQKRIHILGGVDFFMTYGAELRIFFSLFISGFLVSAEMWEALFSSGQRRLGKH
jgi:hypothetical protein